jgi:hypothetical protein
LAQQSLGKLKDPTITSLPRQLAIDRVQARQQGLCLQYQVMMAKLHQSGYVIVRGRASNVAKQIRLLSLILVVLAI